MRRFMLGLGLVVLAVSWVVLPPLARHAFWAHMTLHMAVVAVAAPLIAIGIAGGRFDPVPRAPGLFAPIPASILELAVVWAWHAPRLHHWARHTTLGLVTEQLTFLGTGLLLWLAAVGSDPRDQRSRRAAGVIALLLTSMHMTLLGALLALGPRTLFDHGAPGGGLTVLEDQHLGGAIMLLVGGIAYLAGGLALTVGLVREPARVRA